MCNEDDLILIPLFNERERKKVMHDRLSYLYENIAIWSKYKH